MKLAFPFPESYHGKIVKYESCYLYYGRIENHNTIVWFKTSYKHYPVPSISEYGDGECSADLLAHYEILE
jgi:hypothetical protein